MCTFLKIFMYRHIVSFSLLPYPCNIEGNYRQERLVVIMKDELTSFKIPILGKKFRTTRENDIFTVQIMFKL